MRVYKNIYRESESGYFGRSDKMMKNNACVRVFAKCIPMYMRVVYYIYIYIYIYIERERERERERGREDRYFW